MLQSVMDATDPREPRPVDLKELDWHEAELLDKESKMFHPVLVAQAPFPAYYTPPQKSTINLPPKSWIVRIENTVVAALTEVEAYERIRPSQTASRFDAFKQMITGKEPEPAVTPPPVLAALVDGQVAEGPDPVPEKKVMESLR